MEKVNFWTQLPIKEEIFLIWLLSEVFLLNFKQLHRWIIFERYYFIFMEMTTKCVPKPPWPRLSEFIIDSCNTRFATKQNHTRFPVLMYEIRLEQTKYLNYWLGASICSSWIQSFPLSQTTLEISEEYHLPSPRPGFSDPVQTTDLHKTRFWQSPYHGGLQTQVTRQLNQVGLKFSLPFCYIKGWCHSGVASVLKYNTLIFVLKLFKFYWTTHPYYHGPKPIYTA